MVGLDGIEPSTSRLSGVRSNRTELQAPEKRLSAFYSRASLVSSVKEPLFSSSILQNRTTTTRTSKKNFFSFLRKEVIQPLVPQRLPCYDFTPIISHTLGACPPEGLAPRLLVQPTLMV